MGSWGKSQVRIEKDKRNQRIKLSERVLSDKIKKNGEQRELLWETRTT